MTDAWRLSSRRQVWVSTSKKTKMVERHCLRRGSCCDARCGCQPAHEPARRTWSGAAVVEAIIQGYRRCAETLFDSLTVDVNIPAYDGGNVLTAAVSHVGHSIDACCPLVRLLASRRLTRASPDQAIAMLSMHMPTDAQSVEASDHDDVLSSRQHAPALLLPVLQAEASGDRRWCAYCLKLSSDRNLGMCTQCNMVGYCPDSKCQKRHWTSAGGHTAECAVLLEARLPKEKEQTKQSLK